VNAAQAFDDGAIGTRMSADVGEGFVPGYRKRALLGLR